MQNDWVSPDVMAGFELPPAIWLNEQLAQRRRAWRVINAKGRAFDIIDVSR